MSTKTKKSATTVSATDKALDRFAEMMIEKIETIQNDWKKPWFCEGSSFLPENISGRYYNGMNSLMLMMHCEKEGYKYPVFATFDRIKVLQKDNPELRLCKGEKAFPVFITTFTVVNPKTKEKIKYEDYKRMDDDQRSDYNVFPKLNVYRVFNISQTNMEETCPDLWNKITDKFKPVERVQGEEFSFPPMDYMIANSAWLCPITPKHGDDAYYSISKDLIVVPEKSQFKNGEAFYGNLFHEMAHSTGAESRLNRLKPTSFGSKQYASEELVAELTAALVATKYGITKNIKEDSCPYIKSWLDTLKEEPSFIKSILFDVKRASSLITQKIDKITAEHTSTVGE